MVKINPADNPKFSSPRTVAGSPPGAPGIVKTEGELEEMMETYKEVDETPALSPAEVEPLLPEWADVEDGELYAQPPGWSGRHGLSDQRKDILQYRAGGHSRQTIEEILDCHQSTVANACRVFEFLLHNESSEWNTNDDPDVCNLLLKTFAAEPRNHPEYPTEDEKDGYECEGCGETWDSQSALAGHRGNCPEADTDYPEPDTPDGTNTTTDVTAGAETVSAKVSHDEATDTAPVEEPDTDALCVSEVMDKGEWRETVQVLLNSETPGSDAKAERLMSVLTDWPGE